jgi:hypothetical protein
VDEVGLVRTPVAARVECYPRILARRDTIDESIGVAERINRDDLHERWTVGDDVCVVVQYLVDPTEVRRMRERLQSMRREQTSGAESTSEPQECAGFRVEDEVGLTEVDEFPSSAVALSQPAIFYDIRRFI